MMIYQAIFLSVVAAIGVISASLCAPALPFIADHFSSNFSYIQFTISLFLVGNALGQMACGPLSDQIGQRATLLGGLLLYVLASCGCALADRADLLFAARFFQGMGSAGGPVLSRAIAMRMFPPAKAAQIQSYGAIGVGIASALAIFCSGQLTLVSWRMNFWLAAGLGLVLMVWASWALRNTSIANNPVFSWKQTVDQVKQVMQHPRFWGSALSHSFTYGLMYAYIAMFPFFLMEWHGKKDPAEVGRWSAYMIGVYMFGAFVASRLAVKKNHSDLIKIGILVQCLSGIVLAMGETPWISITALLLFNSSIGMILPLTAASALAPFAQGAVGTASSALGLSYRMIGSLLSMLLCQLPLAGGHWLGVGIVFFSIVSWAGFQLFNEKGIASAEA